MYDDLIGTFTKSGYVDEETQKDDPAIVNLVAEVNDVIRRRELTTSASSAKPNRQLGKLESRDMKI